MKEIKAYIHRASLWYGEKDKDLEDFFIKTHTSYITEEEEDKEKVYYYVPLAESDLYIFIKMINEYFKSEIIVDTYYDKKVKARMVELYIYDDYIE